MKNRKNQEVRMGMWYCNKHKKLSMGSRDLDKDKIHLCCGCDLTEQQSKEFRVTKRYTYELSDGRKLEKVSERWIIKSTPLRP